MSCFVTEKGVINRMLEINLKQLEAFVSTAEYSSFTKAGEALY